MLEELRQVLRAVALLAPKRQSGGLLVVVWSQAEGHGQKCCCTVVATGGWHKKMSEKNLQAALTDINEGILPNLLWSVMPDPEEVSRFSNLYGPVKLSLTFQMKDVRISPECQAHVESFLHTFSLVNAAIEVQLIINLSLQKFRKSFRAKFRSKVSLPDQPPAVLDATCVAIPHVCVGGGPWCAGGHAVLGSKVPLSIPLEVMDRGLFGELNAQLVLLLTPCMRQFPNLQTNLCQIQVLFYAPSKIPVIGPSHFFQSLPSHIDGQELGLHSLQWSGFTDPSNCGNIVFTVESEHPSESEERERCLLFEQNLSVFVFLRHSDPFMSHFSEVLSTETLLGHHLEDILQNNRQAVVAAFQNDLRSTLKLQNQRRKNHQKFKSGVRMMLKSTMSIVRSSCSVDFRRACFTRMMVNNSHDLSTSLGESLTRVTSWKFVRNSRCFSAREEDGPGLNGVSRPAM